MSGTSDTTRQVTSPAAGEAAGDTAGDAASANAARPPGRSTPPPNTTIIIKREIDITVINHPKRPARIKILWWLATRLAVETFQTRGDESPRPRIAS
jgi:hypothetical protein